MKSPQGADWDLVAVHGAHGPTSGGHLRQRPANRAQGNPGHGWPAAVEGPPGAPMSDPRADAGDPVKLTPSWREGCVPSSVHAGPRDTSNGDVGGRVTHSELTLLSKEPASHGDPSPALWHGAAPPLRGPGLIKRGPATASQAAGPPR